MKPTVWIFRAAEPQIHNNIRGAPHHINILVHVVEKTDQGIGLWAKGVEILACVRLPFHLPISVRLRFVRQIICLSQVYLQLSFEAFTHFLAAHSSPRGILFEIQTWLIIEIVRHWHVESWLTLVNGFWDDRFKYQIRTRNLISWNI